MSTFALRAASAVIGLLAASIATAAATERARASYSFLSATGSSGIHLALYELPGAQRTYLTVTYDAGSADDPKGKEGLAHLVEHLTFLAHAPGQPTLRDRLEAESVRWNAFTTRDDTTYVAICKGSQVLRIAELEAVRMRDPLAGVTEEDLRREREVVLSEIRVGRDHGGGSMGLDALASRAFAGTAYGQPIAGTEESVRRITLEDVRAFVRTHYQPHRATVAISTPGSGAEVARGVAGHLDELYAGPPTGTRRPARTPIAPGSLPPPEDRAERRTASVSQPTVWIGWVVPGASEAGRAQAAAASAILGRFLPSRLYERSSDGGTRVEGMTRGVWAMDGASMVWLALEVRSEEDAPWALERVKDSLFLLQRDRFDVHLGGTGLRESGTIVTALSVPRIQAALMNGLFQSLETGAGATEPARSWRRRGEPNFAVSWEDEVTHALTPDFWAYFQKYVTRERTVALLAVPSRGVASVSRGMPEGEDRAGGEASPDLVREAPDAALVPARTDPPRVAIPDTLETRTLENGLRVVLARQGRLPLATGRLSVEIDLEGAAGLPPGTGELAITARENGKGGASIRRAPGTVHVSASRFSSEVTDLLDALARWVRDTDTEDVGRNRRWLMLGHERSDGTPWSRATRALVAGLFPGHPLSEPVTPATLATIEEDQIKSWRRQIRPDRATLVLVSDRPAGPDLWKAIGAAFGSWKRPAEEPPPRRLWTSPGRPASRRVVIVDQPGVTQPVLAIGIRLPVEGGAVDDPALDALVALVGLRANDALRGGAGVSYGSLAAVREFGPARALVIEADVSEEATPKALALLLDIPAALARAPVVPGALERAKRRAVREWAFQADTVVAAAWRLERLARDGAVRPDAGEGYLTSWSNLDAARVRAVAESLLVGRESVVIVGDASRLKPRLEAAGYPVDVSGAPIRPSPR